MSAGRNALTSFKIADFIFLTAIAGAALRQVLAGPVPCH